MIAFSHSMRVPSTINEVVTPIIFTIIYCVFTITLGLRMVKIYIGSSNAVFTKKLDSLTFSDYKNGSEYAIRRQEIEAGKNIKDIDVEKLQSLNAKSKVMPSSPSLKPRTIAILLFVDILIAIALELSLGELPRLITVIIIEAIVFILAIRESCY